MCLDKQKARYKSRKLYPESQKCEVPGCNKLGIRHHEDYEDASRVVWLCPHHHTVLHWQMRQLGKPKPLDDDLLNDMTFADLMYSTATVDGGVCDDSTIEELRIDRPITGGRLA